ncbi:MAG: YitT family protein [Lactovum sp.]
MLKFIKIHFLNLLMVAVGTSLYSFGFVKFNMENHLAQGGFSGVALILHANFGIDPAITQVLVNIPLLFIGYHFLGKRTFIYTAAAIGFSSLWLSIFQRIDFQISVDNDMLIAGLLAGGFAGVGLGIVFRAGGTTGGADIIARIIQEKQGVPLSRTFIIIDAMVLIASLTYIDIKHMMYTLICSFVTSQVLGFVQSGSYTVRGMLIITSYPHEIADKILKDMSRGVTFINGEGAFSRNEKKIIYVVLNPREIQEARHIIQKIDANSFTSIINVHEIIGDFSYAKSKYAKNNKNLLSK